MDGDKKDVIDLITAPVAPAPAPENVVVVSETDLLGGSAAPVPPIQPEAPPVTAPGEPLAPETSEVKRGRGRPPGTKNKPKADFSDIPPAAVAETLVDYKQMSGALFDMSTGILTNAFGPEWQPRSIDERGAVCMALEVYLKSKQAKDIPPGLMLTIVVVAYAAPRLQAPSTKEKLLPMLNWAWIKIKSFFGRKKQPEFKIIPADKQN